ncbi:glycosyl transferase family protein [Vibrio maritimus]|uniref:glycosyl transferase family protein n=1 Tax=Vibrio maritimus TaxID=990268 RepID=UPI004068100F
MSLIQECIRTVGRGSRGRGPLTQTQAREVMQAYLAGEVGDDQMAMLMMLIRVRDETPEEIAGFVQALKSTQEQFADLDWPLYAGKRTGQTSGLPWHLVAAKILADSGVKILLHGDLDKMHNRLHARHFLGHLNINTAASLDESKTLLEQFNIAYLPLDNFLPQVKVMLDWKHRYGLRTPINTVARALNPANAPFALRGSFHPGFQELHAKVESLIHLQSEQTQRTVSFKGQSGETEYNPKVSQTIWWAEDGKVNSHYVEETMTTQSAIPCPLGTGEDEQDMMANTIISTLTIALFTLSGDWDSAESKAKTLWHTYCDGLTSEGTLC